MPERIINYYEFQGPEPEWSSFKKLFKRNVSKFNVPFFQAGSDVEQEFLRFCSTSNFAPLKKTILPYDGKSANRHKFLFLCLKDDRNACVDADHQQRFVDLSTACPGGGAFGLCGRGAKQTGAVVLKKSGSEVVEELGILSPAYPKSPRIYLVSASVANALQEAGATGCEFSPTDSLGCFQLRIVAETRGPTRIGRAKMGPRCPVCGIAKMFFSDAERYFRAGDLENTDFQICRRYHADNVGDFEILNGFPIVSDRVFSHLRSLKSRGFSAYSTDPPIQHACVQLRDTEAAQKSCL